MLTVAFVALGVVILVLTILGFRRQRVVLENHGDPVLLYVHTAVYVCGGLLLILGPLLQTPIGVFVLLGVAVGLIESCNGLPALRRSRSRA
jgi:hypothetical protein